MRRHICSECDKPASGANESCTRCGGKIMVPTPPEKNYRALAVVIAGTVALLFGLSEFSKWSAARNEAAAAREAAERAPLAYQRAISGIQAGDLRLAQAALREGVAGDPDHPIRKQAEELLRAARIAELENEALDQDSSASSRQRAYLGLVRLDPGNSEKWRKAHNALNGAAAREERQAELKAASEARERARAAAALEIVDWNWTRNRSINYVSVQGRVTNVSGAPMRGVIATVEFETESGGFISKVDALIDLNPILPGQTSTFDLSERWNPAMHNASLSFRRAGGGSIPTRRR